MPDSSFRVGRNINSVTGERGQILLLTAFSMVVLLGIGALSLDASYMYDKRNTLYAAADAAAKSGAIEVRRTPTISQTSLENFANQQVNAHGLTAASCLTTTLDLSAVCVHHPPASGPFTGNAGYVEVIVSQRTSTFLGVILGMTNMTPAARAVAGSSSAEQCIVTLSPGMTSMQLGNSTLNLTNCEVDVGGYLNTTNPNALINGEVAITETCIGGHCPQANQQTGVPPPSDPLAGLPAPTNPGGCQVANSSTLNLTPGCYSSITATTAAPVVHFAPGVYYVTGPILIGQNAYVTGSGVMIYLTGSGSLTVQNGCGTTLLPCYLTAQTAAQTGCAVGTTGCYTGILFFQDPSDSNPVSFGNNGTWTLSGAMYFPASNVDFGNSLGTSNDCTIFVANTITITNGTSNFSNTCSAFGGSPLQTTSLAE